MKKYPVFRLSTFASALALLVAWAVPFHAFAGDSVPVPAPAPTGKCMMWKVSSDTATVYLVGSMHLATPEVYPLPREMEEAFEKSRVLVVEVNINKLDKQKVQALLQDKGMYKDEQTLSKTVSKETYDALGEFCATAGVPIAALDKLKPWVVSTVVEVVGIQKLGLDPKLGIDQHFLDLADKSEKKIEELETADFQISMLSSFDPKLQEKSLAAALAETKDLKKDIGILKEAWMSGDAAGLADLLHKPSKEHPELEEFTKKVIDDRNGPMAEKVEAYLKGNQTVFVVAGVAHMVGDKGIVKILQDHQRVVEQSTATKPVAP